MNERKKKYYKKNYFQTNKVFIHFANFFFMCFAIQKKNERKVQHFSKKYKSQIEKKIKEWEIEEEILYINSKAFKKRKTFFPMLGALEKRNIYKTV